MEVEIVYYLIISLLVIAAIFILACMIKGGEQ